MTKVERSNTTERSLYECFHARVKGDRVYCQKGHPLQDKGRQNGSISMQRLARGEPLVMSICQECADFEVMGEPLPSEERGWLRARSNQKPDNERLTCRKSLAR
jgi:hypothetical protein